MGDSNAAATGECLESETDWLVVVYLERKRGTLIRALLLYSPLLVAGRDVNDRTFNLETLQQFEKLCPPKDSNLASES